MKWGIVHFYERLFMKNSPWRSSVDDLPFLEISTVNKDWLERPFDEVEVLLVLKKLNGDKLLARMVSLWFSIRVVGAF